MKLFYLGSALAILMLSCSENQNKEGDMKKSEENAADNFMWQTEQFADVRILRYQIPGWEKLTPRQRIYAYYLNEAGLHGRDIFWDQNYRHNLAIRKVLERIFTFSEDLDKSGGDWGAFETWAKRVFFSSGIHHHYSMQKFEPEFSREYLSSLMEQVGANLPSDVLDVIFDPSIDVKKVNKDPSIDLVKGSAVNFYDPTVTEQEAVEFYTKLEASLDPERPVSLGLNSKLVRSGKGLAEEVYKEDGLYGEAIEKIVENLEKARDYAENQAQVNALEILIEFYRTGDLRTWDEYNIAWVQATGGDVDYINGFIENYDDPLSMKATFESIVQVRDLEASEQMALLSKNAQWFEDHSTIQGEYKKSEVKGISYRIINAVGEAGATSPATPIGVNLPNANWIREVYGSKSISLGNIEHAYEKSSGKGLLAEFTFSTHERERAEKYGDLGSRLHTALHEVIGHASGKIKPGVGVHSKTLKNYASTLEEARADLVALYFIMDGYMKKIGLVENQEPGKAEYDAYIRNGLMLQLRRLKPGENIEEDHMRNRQLVAAWAFEMGKADRVIEKKVVGGKTYYVINNYGRLREIFGQQLREIQRIKSEGDYAAGRDLVEKYGVKVNPDLHAEVLRRAEKLNIAPYAGFINPELKPVFNEGKIVDVEVTYPEDFIGQMLRYGEKYSNLRTEKVML